MDCVILVDNSNIFIEGRKLSAARKGVKAANPEDRAPVDPSWRIDFATLLLELANGRNIRAAILIGSRPPPNDNVWKMAEEGGFADVTVLEPEARPAEAVFDVLSLGEPPDAEAFGRLAPSVRPGGWLVARWAPGAALPAKVREQLERAGFTPAEPVEKGGGGVFRAQKAARVEPPLHLQFVSFASLLMDIRTRLPLQSLKSEPQLRVEYQVPPARLPDLPVDYPKVAVMQRPAALDVDGWRGSMASAIAAGWVVVLEFDDHPHLIAEVHHKKSSEQDMLRFGYVHAVQTSSPPLIEAFSAYNPEVRMFPNAVFDLLPFPAGERPQRVFYSAVIRGDYAIRVAKALAPAVEQFPEAQFLVVGDQQVFQALPTENKTFVGYRTYESYLNLMSRCSISLSPIAPLPLRDTKSDAKYLDASRAGVLTIASPTIYDRVIEHGVNGLLAPEIEDWAPLLARALGDQSWREAMARRAWEHVRKERMFANQVAERRDWYLDLWRRRDELNESLMQRMPGLREAVEARRRQLRAG